MSHSLVIVVERFGVEYFFFGEDLGTFSIERPRLMVNEHKTWIAHQSSTFSPLF